MTAPTATDSLLTIAAQLAAIAALSADRALATVDSLAVLTQRQETLHWLATTGAGCLAGIAALLAIYRHIRAIRRDRRKD